MATSEAEYTFTETLYNIQPKVVVGFTHPLSEIKDEEWALLSKILTALKLTVHSVQMITLQDYDIEKWGDHQPDRLIIFGKMDGLNFYEVGKYKGINVVVAEKLSSLLANDMARKQLWQALKQLFGV